VLTQQNVGVDSLYDLVILKLGDRRLRIPYQNVFEIVNNMRMAAKMAGRHEGVAPPSWRQVLESVRGQLPEPAKRHPHFRRSMEQPNVKNWRVGGEGSLVVLNFDDLEFKTHFSDALRLMELMRAHAHRAKNWAGDTSKSMRMTANLTDAANNAKYNYVH